MSAADPGADRSQGQHLLHVYGPLAGIVAFVLIVGVLAALGRADAPTGTTAGGGGGPSRSRDDGPFSALSFADAKARGIAADFGPHCDTATGKVAIPSNFAIPCFAHKANNGSSSPGVTADEITIVLYQPPPDPLVDQILKVVNADDTPQQVADTYRGFFQLYEDYYELYGRKIKLITYQGTGISFDSVSARADAVKIAEEIKPFAVIGGPLVAPDFSQELAARKVIQIDLASARSVDFYKKSQPYIWNTLQAPDQTCLHVGEYLQKQLQGKPAAHAGDPTLQGQKRRFGLVYLGLTEEAVQVQKDCAEKIKGMGVDLVAEVAYKDPISLQATAAEQIAKLKAADVTSVLFTGDPLAPGPLTREATAQQYFPEWIITGSALVDSTVFGRSYDQRQWSHAFGVSQLFARGLPEGNFANGLFTWYYGVFPPAKSGSLIVFANATTLVSGLQAAGPDLTPAHFRDGLFSGDAMGGGLTVPQVSFGRHGYWPDDDYTSIDDAVEVWWNAELEGPDERGVTGKGMLMYVDGGKRYTLGQWPSRDSRAFDPSGAVPIYREVPEGDRVKDYPKPQGVPKPPGT